MEDKDIAKSLPGGRFIVEGYAYVGKARKHYNVKPYFIGKNSKGKFIIVDLKTYACEIQSLEEMKEAVEFIMSKSLIPHVYRCGD